MRSKRLLWALTWTIGLVAAATLTTASGAVTYLRSTGGWKKAGNERRLKQTLSFSNGRTEYRLLYDVSVGPDTPKGKCFSHQWVYSVGVPSIGMTGPAMCNWYSQGFLDVIVDGESLKDYPAQIDVVRSGGPDALATMTWTTSKGTVRVHWLLRAGDDKLLLRVEWDCPQPPKSVALRVLCYPSWFRGKKDRWIVTAQREVQHPRLVQLDPAAEPWVFYHDRAPRPKNARGACALMYRPDDALGAAVDVQAYPNWTTISFKPWLTHATVALWDFTGMADDAANLAYLREHGPQILKQLDEASRADWRRPFTKTVELPGERGKLLDKGMAFEPTPFDVATPAVETRRRVWAKPLAGGPVKIICIAPRWSQREVVELAQRFDVDYAIASVDKPNVLFVKRWMMLYGSFQLYGYRDRNTVTMLGEMFDKIRGDYDCIVVADVLPETLPGYFVQTLRNKVRAGTGLVVIGAGKGLIQAFGKEGRKPAHFAAAVPIGALPVLRDFAWGTAKGKKPIATAFELGDGRLLALNYPPSSGANLSYTPNTTRALDFVVEDYDYYQSLLAKAILWAAQREQPAQIATLSKDSLRVECAAPVGQAELAVRVHDRQRKLGSTDSRTIKLAKGVNHLPLKIAAPRAGACFVDVSLVQNGKTLDWASTAFEAEVRGGIDGIELNKSVLKPGDKIEGVVKLRGLDKLARVELRVVDAFDRVVARGAVDVAAGAKEARFALPLAHPIAVAHRVEATLYDGRAARDWAVCEFTVPNRGLDDFMFLMWTSAYNSRVRLAVLRELRKHAVDTIDNVGLTQASGPTMAAACRNAAWANLRSVPYITRIAFKGSGTTVRKPCLTDPEYMNAWMDALRTRAAAAAPYGPPAYTLGDENFLAVGRTDVCASPTCKAGFREYLKDVYGTLDALNAEWDTTLASWDAAEPITFDQAKETKQFARWVDHRRFMERVFTRAHVLGRQAIREADPGARVGFDGVFNLDSWHGYDYYTLTQACDLNQVYASRLNQIEYMRSFAPKDALLGAWYNRIGNADEVSAKRVPWHLLFSGFNSSWYWMSFDTGPAALFPDLRPTPQMQWMEESNREIKAGIGKLIMHAERQHDGVAIHYSQASVHGNTILDRKLPAAHLGAMFAVEDLGLQYNFVAYEQIEQGALDKYKVLVMPQSCAVSKKEAAAIRKFVERGGLVIADVFPAVMDGHCKLLKQGALDDVFGAAATTTVSAAMPSEGPVSLQAKAFGRGKALLLGYPLAEYTALRDKGEETVVREALRQVLANHGVSAQVQVATDAGPVSACEVVRFRNGGIEYVGIVTEDNIPATKPMQATITFPRESDLYDVRAERHLGRVRQVQTEIVPGVPLLYAMLPEPVQGITLQSDPKTLAPGAAATLRVQLRTRSGKLAGAHVVRIEATDPKGRRVEHYSQNLLTTQPTAEAVLPFAANDPAGAWTITATDVVSGTRAKARITLNP